MKTLIGWDIQDITPTQPVELIGQYYQRVSKGVRDPLSVTALAIEQATAAGSEQAVMVTMDIIYVAQDFLDEVRRHACARVPDLKPQAIFINATHIHSGPSWFVPFRWWQPAAGALPPAEIRAFLLERTVRAVVNAWKVRQPGRVGAASAYASVGFSRRMCYADGSAMMYGETNRADFIGVEGGNDPVVRMMFTWDERDRMTGVIVNVACPAQVLESDYVVSADYFGELRKRIHATYGAQVKLLPQVSAAGCQSPRNLPAQSKDEVNYWNESGMVAIAERLEKAVAEGYAAARKNIQRAPVLKHTMTKLALPVRRASAEEYQAACAEVKRLTKSFADEATASKELFAQFVADTHAGEKRQPHGPFDNKELDFVLLENAQAVTKRHGAQDATPTFSMELHALRLGDCAFVTNPFELFLDYGQMILARSRAKRTFLIQFACDVGRYLPTARAVAGGGYSALIINGAVGPEGGQMLVDASVKA
ncbi:MAG: hypothetical protein NTZ16_07695, partial [Verrucomicrobia bacterium]|nr:hypothetical protein [Verrucomicrobiota bacterium]